MAVERSTPCADEKIRPKDHKAWKFENILGPWLIFASCEKSFDENAKVWPIANGCLTSRAYIISLQIQTFDEDIVYKKSVRIGEWHIESCTAKVVKDYRVAIL